MAVPNPLTYPFPMNPISNCHKNLMGTLSFDAHFPGMRKPQDFIVYPMQDSGTEIRVQSDNRFGRVNLDTGAVVLSPSSGSAHAGNVWLMLCELRGTAIRFTLAEEDRVTLRNWVKHTGGVLVGSSFVKTENIGALAL